MPELREVSQFTTRVTVRVIGLEDGVQTIEMISDGTVTGSFSGTTLNTLTFIGTNERGSYSGPGVGYLDSGQAVQGESEGVYWLAAPGEWMTRGTAKLTPGAKLVVEGRVKIETRTWSGRFLEPA